VGRAGTVTVLFTDVVGSTELIAALGDDAWHALLHGHLEQLRVIVVRHAGEVIKTLGDGIMAAFGSAVSAMDAAADMQAVVAHENRRRAIAVGVRVGVSGGDATYEDGDWFGIPVVEAARLCALATPGQALVSALAKAMAGSRGGHVYEPVGELQLKGIADPVMAYALGPRAPSHRPIPLPDACQAANRGPFTGRAAEQATLRALWKVAVSGQRRVVLLSGEPGVGKTRLAVQFVSEAHAAGGAVVLFGRCDEHIRAPYQPLAEAIEHFVLHAPEDVLRQHTDEWGGRLAGWAPTLLSRVPDAPAVLTADPETDRLRLFDAANALLDSASGDDPVVLVLDDVHWADEPTLVYLRHLVRASASFPLLVIATYRDTELVRTHPLSETLADFRKEAGVERMALRGLDADEVRSLLESFAGERLDAAGDAAARTLQAETEGNPFFVRQMIGHLVETETLVRQDDHWILTRPVGELGLPEGVREVIGRRLSRLSPMVNELLAAAAVIGREFDVSVLAAITGHGDDDIVDLLEEALAARLIGEVPIRLGRYSFSHALIRTTLYEEISTNRRVRLHRAVARSLEGVGSADVGEVAYHFYEAAPLGDAAAALEWVQRAAEDATARAGYELAVSWYERALEIEEMLGPADPARQAALLIALGRARNDAGAVMRARSDFVAAATLARQAGRPDLLARAAIHYGGRYPGLVDPSDPVGPALLAEAHASLPPTDSSLRVAVLDAQVSWLSQSPDRDDYVRPAQQALAMARRLGQPYGIFRALLSYQFALLGAPRPVERLPVADEAIELAQSVGNSALVIAALNIKGMHLLALGRLSEVIDLYRECARLDPISTTDIMSQFDVGLAAGHGGQILVAASTATLVPDVSLVDLGEHRLRDLSGPHRLFQVTAVGLGSSFAPLRTMDAVPGNLPVQLTSFVGREVEVKNLVEAVRAQRLVTLTGVGGVGKTRLAVQVAAELVSEFPDGVWLIELAPVGEPAVVPDVVATTLGVTPSELGMTDSIVRALSGRHLLLVLDNCEHVLDAAADLVHAILAGTTTVKILATSREGLRVSAEHLWLVPSLNLRGGTRSAAVELFVERARAVDADFNLEDEADAIAVVEICQRLDGIALAIELAAARMVSMSPQDVRDRLGDGFRLLAGSRRGLERHQTLRHVVSWSYDLLEEPERRMLTLCSVFADGFDLAAAAHLDEHQDDYAVLDVLDSLVRKSLVIAQRAGGRTRYGLLETIRQFAEEQLAAAGTIEAVRRRHAIWFAERARATWLVWDGPDQPSALEWIDLELANLRVAFRWAADAGELTMAASIASHATFVSFGLQRLEPVAWAEELLRSAESVELPGLPRLYAAASLCSLMNRAELGAGYADKAVALEDDPRFEPLENQWSRYYQAVCHLYAGDSERALALFTELASQAGPARLYGLCGRLQVLPLVGCTGEAAAMAEETLAAARAHGNPYLVAWAMYGSSFAAAHDDPGRALAGFTQALAYATAHRLGVWEAMTLRELARVEALHGDLDRSLTLYDRAIESFHQSATMTNFSITLVSLITVFEIAGRPEVAATVYGMTTRVSAIVVGRRTVVDRLRTSLGETTFERCVAAGAALEPTDTVHYVRKQISAALDELRSADPANRTPDGAEPQRQRR
jgi:predicted ATPase